MNENHFNLEKSVRELQDEGLTILPGVYSKQQCKDYVDRCRGIAERLAKMGKINLESDCHNIWNFFRHDPDFLPLVYNPFMDQIFKKVMDEDYVLIAANIINRQTKGTGQHGAWHTDSRYLAGKRLASGFNHGMIIMLEPFTRENAATQYVPRSHLDRSIPDRQGSYPYEHLEGDAGTMVLFDSGLWHRGGPSCEKSRWGVFSMYGPWFMKPYFRFPDMIGEEAGKTLDPELRRLFHFNSTPPLDENERLLTLVKNYSPAEKDPNVNREVM
jgi:hypothetical protein